MDLRTVLLLPGQGAYRPGAFAGPVSAPVAELLDVVDAVAAEFGHAPVSPLLTDAEAADGRRLAETDPFALQLAIYAAALVYAREVDLREPADVVIGHSMGEMAAAAHAGCFTAADGARIAAHRARALEHTAAGAGGMLALTLPARRATALLAAAELPGARLAVVNAPRHVVASGPEDALGRLAALADVLGVRAVRLTAPYPFHNPLLATAQAEFAAAIEGIAERPARRRLYSPALGGLVTDDTDVKASLVAQVTRPVDFLAALRELQTYGLESVVECGRAGLGELVRQATGRAARTAERWLAEDTGLEPAAPAPAPRAVPAAEPRVPTPVATAAPAAPVSGTGPAPVPATEPVAQGSAAARPVPAAPAAGGDVLATLQQVYADRLGYPVEAMDPEADLEGDLGIDSLKRMEVLSTLIDRFGLHHVADDTRFALQSTLGGLARLIDETGRSGGTATAVRADG
ncbi:acyltransferase domain-containing protein [Streptomyces aculeolatus]|uniref:acyltransferase domain-containing protein n=1 Tax=Streptomyces aculeolatus TaxID=270689 RepID=UPI001CECB537|nr:acyltransferase domain-containing protein [Streptomyces aculeolatus]